jgi:flagellar P-ring protein precursor FlgI
MRLHHVLSLCAALATFGRDASAEKLRDLVDVAGARENQLIGYGIVVGLQGTGDDVTVPYAAQSLNSLLTRLGLKIDQKQIRARNVAAVVVTATLPAFSKPGGKLDVTVSSIGNAKSILGGTVVQTLLKGADQKTYAVAQGNLIVGGFEAKGASGSSTKQGVTTSGRIPEGAIVEKEVATAFVTDGKLRLDLRTPGFATAARITDAVEKKLGAGIATASDGGAVLVKVPDAYSKKTVELVALLEDLEVAPVRKARVVINEKTGTIVASGDVRLAPVAIVHGGLTIVVKETPSVSQPPGAVIVPGGKGTIVAPGGGSTVTVPKSEIEVKEGDGTVKYLPGAASLSDVAAALGTLGLSPRALAGVLQALRSAGALEAEVVVQ